MSSVPSSSRPKLPHPWSNEAPKSTLKPHAILMATMRELNKIDPAHFISNFPYEREPNGTTMPYREWHGNGIPPTDIGYPGDIYVQHDCPGVGNSFALYASMSPRGWMRWIPSGNREEDLIPHPLINHRYLWCSPSKISWYARNTIRKEKRRPYPVASDAIKKAVDAQVGATRLGKRGNERVDSDSSDDDSDDCGSENESANIACVTVSARRGKRGRFEGPHKDIEEPLIYTTQRRAWRKPLEVSGWAWIRRL